MNAVGTAEHSIATMRLRALSTDGQLLDSLTMRR